MCMYTYIKFNCSLAIRNKNGLPVKQKTWCNRLFSFPLHTLHTPNITITKIQLQRSRSCLKYSNSLGSGHFRYLLSSKYMKLIFLKDFLLPWNQTKLKTHLQSWYNLLIHEDVGLRKLLCIGRYGLNSPSLKTWSCCITQV